MAPFSAAIIANDNKVTHHHAPVAVERTADPRSLPLRFTAQSPQGRNAAERRISGAMSVLLEADRVTVQRTVANGVPIKLSLALEDFEGVAARLEPGAEALATTVHIELKHRDPSLSVPLLQGTNLDAVAQDWTNWSLKLALPMLLVEADGDVVARHLPKSGDVQRASSERRRNHVTSRRRGRFLRRRKCGDRNAPRITLAGREIIART